jgi:Protein of unknown function (DUF4239)
MINWLYDLPIVWLIVLVFAATYLVAGLIYLSVTRLAVGSRAAAFAAVSPGLLPPLGIVFALVVGFLAAGVWNDGDRAQLAVNREASSLRTAILLVDSFPAAQAGRMRSLIRRHIHETVVDEWPAMAHRRVTLTVIPAALAEALDFALALKPHTEGEKVAQREITTSLEDALDARRQRIIISDSRVNWLKWLGVIALALLTLLAIAFVHSSDRRTAAIALSIFASAVAVSVVLIASQDRPFGGRFGVKPTLLEQVSPRSP